jgi:hypothetical protein
MERVKEEINNVVDNDRKADDELPSDVLARLSLEEWETRFPMIQACMRETMRLQPMGTTFRRNISGKGIQIGDEVIPNQAFAVRLFPHAS